MTSLCVRREKLASSLTRTRQSRRGMLLPIAQREGLAPRAHRLRHAGRRGGEAGSPHEGAPVQSDVGRAFDTMTRPPIRFNGPLLRIPCQRWSLRRRDLGQADAAAKIRATFSSAKNSTGEVMPAFTRAKPSIAS